MNGPRRLAPVRTWPKRLWTHFWTGKKGLIWLGVILLCLCAPVLVGPHISFETFEDVVRWWGIALQVAGFFLVIAGVEGSLSYLGMTTISKRFRDYIVGFLNVLHVRNVTVGLKTGGLSLMSGRARVRKNISQDASIEEKIEAIQLEIDRIYSEIDGFSASHDGEIKTLHEKIEKRATEAKTESDSLRKRFDVLMAENAEKEFFGALLFVIGIIYSSANGEVARVLTDLLLQ